MLVSVTLSSRSAVNEREKAKLLGILRIILKKKYITMHILRHSIPRLDMKVHTTILANSY